MAFLLLTYFSYFVVGGGGFGVCVMGLGLWPGVFELLIVFDFIVIYSF